MNKTIQEHVKTLLPEVAKTLGIKFNDSKSYLFTGFFKNITGSSYEAIGVIYQVRDWAYIGESPTLAYLNYTSTPSSPP